MCAFRKYKGDAVIKHYIIPVFIPHYGCKHQCIFCNQQKITGMVTPVDAQHVQQTIDVHLARITERRFIEVAFYGGSFTALPLELQQRLLTPAYQALQRGQVNGIRLSTRPDCITDEIVDNLLAFNVTVVELGVQSLDEAVLIASQRGHTVDDVKNAADILRRREVSFGIQIMPGLPGEDWYSLLLTANRAIALRPHFARLYPTIVIDKTELATCYLQGLYQPLTLEAAIQKTAFLKLFFEQHNIPVIRTGLQATEELDNAGTVLAGPYHSAFGELVDGYLFFQMLLQAFEKIPHSSEPIIIRHHRRDQSKIRGISNCYFHQLQQAVHRPIKLVEGTLREGEISIEQGYLQYVISRKMLFFT
jgi:histone acetyltransferase (RNA polymerase elongator complex component)